jgi:2-iminobutanoate/2-iminopropanoate deaminase
LWQGATSSGISNQANTIRIRIIIRIAKEVSSHTVEGQLKNALTNLSVVLDAVGSSVENLLHLRIYVRSELGEYMAAIAPILSQFLAESRPALTGISVASLASPETLVEIEATAALK